MIHQSCPWNPPEIHHEGELQDGAEVGESCKDGVGELEHLDDKEAEGEGEGPEDGAHDHGEGQAQHQQLQGARL